MKPRVVALIPARGGSKRIPRKNILPFAGRPMITWSVSATLESGAFDEVVVSTDDDEIAEVAKAAGASIPYLRPASISDDQSGLTTVIRHAIEWWREQGRPPDIVACAYATAPFLRGIDLAEAVGMLQRRSEADYVLAVASFAAPVQRAIVSGGSGWLEFMWPAFAQTRSQDVPQLYHDAGHFFMGRTAAFMRHATTMSGNTLPYVIPRLLCQDIDTPEDWDHAAELFAYLQARKDSPHR